MVPHVLAALGRTHDLGQRPARRSQLARDAGFDTFNLDLIYGAAGESLDDWRATLDEVLALEPPHVSAYALTVEPGTPLAARRGAPPRRRRPGRQVRARMRAARGRGARVVRDLELGAAGTRVPAQPPVLAQGDYLGIGCAAHSHRDGRRWWNVRTPERYIDAITRASRPRLRASNSMTEERELEATAARAANARRRTD